MEDAARPLTEIEIKYSRWRFRFRESRDGPLEIPKIVNQPQDWVYFQKSIRDRVFARASKMLLRKLDEGGHLTPEERRQARRRYRC